MDNRDQVAKLVERAEALYAGVELANEIISVLTKGERKFSYQLDLLRRDLVRVNAELRTLGFHDSGHAKGALNGDRDHK
jgi:hypothetical protein